MFKIVIETSDPPKVLTYREGQERPVEALTCRDLDEARVYARGIVDGMRTLRNALGFSGPHYQEPTT